MEISREELDRAIEKAAVSAATLTGTKIAEQLSKEEGGCHHSPITPHCVNVLGTAPKCYDFRGIRSWVMCKAWDTMEKEKRVRLPVGEAWQRARETCVME